MELLCARLGFAFLDYVIDNLAMQSEVGHSDKRPSLSGGGPPFEYHSQYGGMWIDRSDFEVQLAAKVASGEMDQRDAETLRTFREDGYIILKQAVSLELVREVNARVDETWRTKRGFVLLDLLGTYHNLRPELRKEPVKVLDLYYLDASLRLALFAPRIAHFLHLLFEEPPLLFQSLGFERGTEQAMHQDTAYVVVDPPMKLAATWIALQDIEPGTGELEYFRGSHRLPDFDFGSQTKNLPAQRMDLHNEFLKSLVSESMRRGLPLERFCPKAGDVLIWHADLVHGGSKIARADKSRLSLVGHYCPVSSNPRYFKSLSHPRKVPHSSGGFYTSFYYF